MVITRKRLVRFTAMFFTVRAYDGLFKIALMLTEKKYRMQFCQRQICADFLSSMSFCQNIPNEILSNTGGYIDSVLFCQSLQSQ